MCSLALAKFTTKLSAMKTQEVNFDWLAVLGKQGLSVTVYRVIFARKEIPETAEVCKIKHYNYFVHWIFSILVRATDE